MSTVFVSVIVADSTDMRVGLFRTEEDRRLDLIDWFNEIVEDGGMDDVVLMIPDKTDIDQVIEIITEETGRNVYLEENFLI